jgi:nucleoside-diphosphate-sugar epimerase
LKTLVTGAGGFLGQYIVEQLVARGDHVRALIRRPASALDRLGVEVVYGDIRNAAAVESACADRDVVFHVAAVAGIWGAWEHFFGINTLGTRHVLAGCRSQGVPRLVYTSSPSVTFAGDDQAGVDESAPYPTRWLCHYQHTKALAEQEVLAANDAQLATCALRPHLIWGPRDPHLVPRLLQRARSGQLRRVGDGTNRIDMVYVENAAQAHLLAADVLSPGSIAAGRAYFISNGEPVNCWQFIDQLLERAGLPPVRRSISTHSAWRLGAMLETVYRLLHLPGEPQMTRFLAAQLGRSHWFDISRARKELGYRPEISMSAGLERLAT